MKAAILTAPNQISTSEMNGPRLSEGDILLRVRAATICGTDIRIFRGKKTAGIRYQSVLGHEFAGEIVRSGGHGGFRSGDRVGVCPFIACGRCHLCKTGRENLCTDGLAFGYEIDGAFAKFIRIPARAVTAGNLRTIPHSMSDGQAALVEPLSCVINGQNKAELRNGDSVAILGAGPIGQMHVRLARLRGAARIIVSEPNGHRREAALEHGADIAINPATEDATLRVMEETDGKGADVAICAIGIPELARQATDIAAIGGRVSLFAGYSSGETAEMDVNAIHYRELTVTGAFGLSRRDYDCAFDMLASGRIDLSGMITHEFDLDHAQDAFAVAESGEAIKVALQGTAALNGRI